MTKSLQLVLLTLILSVAGWMPATASTLVLNFTNSFQNDPPPIGTVQATAVFDDDPLIPLTVGYDVRLTITTTGLDANDFLTETDFNLNTLYNPSNLSGFIVAGADMINSVSVGEDDFKADGDGYYDLQFLFNADPPRMGANQIFIIDLALVGGTLTAADFNFFSADSGGFGPYLAATHIQGGNVTDGGSWISATLGGSPEQQCTPFPECENSNPVPEPTSMVLLGTGLLGLARSYTRRRKR